MDRYIIIFVCVCTILNTNAIEIIRQSETAIEREDSGDTSQNVYPSKNPMKGSIFISSANEINKMAEQAIKDNSSKNTKIVHNNVKVTIRKHSKGNQFDSGRFNETHVSYTWNNLGDNRLNDSRTKNFVYEDDKVVPGVHETDGSYITQGVTSDKNNIDESNGEHTVYTISHKVGVLSDVVNKPTYISESSSVVQSNYINQNVDDSKNKITGSDFKVINELINKNNLSRNNSIGRISEEPVTSFGSQTINIENETGDTKLLLGNYDNVIAPNDGTNNSYTGSKLLSTKAYDISENKNKVTQSGSNINTHTSANVSGVVTKERDSTNKIQDKIYIKGIEHSAVSEKGQIKQLFKGPPLKNLSSMDRDSIIRADSQNTLIDTIMKKAADVFKSYMNNKQSIKSDYQRHHVFIDKGEENYLDMAKIRVNLDRLKKRPDLVDAVFEKNSKNIQSFWLLLEQYVSKNPNQSIENLNKMLTLLSIFTKLNKISETGVNIDVMVDNIIKILDNPQIDVRIETEQYNSGKTNKYVGTNTKVITVERSLEDNNIHVQKYESKLENIRLPNRDKLVQYNFDGLIKDTMTPSVTTITDKTKHQKEITTEMYGKHVKGVKDDFMADIIAMLDETEHTTLALDTKVIKDNVESIHVIKNNTNPSFDNKINDVPLFPSNVDINNVKPKEILARYDHTTSKNNNLGKKSYFNLNILDTTESIRNNIDNNVYKPVDDYKNIVRTNDHSQIITNNIPDKMFFVPQTPEVTKPSDYEDTVTIKPNKDYIVTVYGNNDNTKNYKPVIQNRAKAPTLDYNYNSNKYTIINTSVDGVGDVNDVESLVLEKPETINIVGDEKAPKHYELNYWIQYLLNKGNVPHVYENNNISKLPEVDFPKKDSVNSIVIGHEPSRYELDPVQNPKVSTSNSISEKEKIINSILHYLYNQQPLAVMNASIPIKTATSLEEEDSSNHVILNEKPLHMKHNHNEITPEIQASPYNPYSNIFMNLLKVQNPELFMAYDNSNRNENEINIRPDSFKKTTTTTESHLYKKNQDSQVNVFDSVMMNPLDVNGKQNVESIWSLVLENIKSKENKVTTIKPVTIVTTNNNDFFNEQEIITKDTLHTIDLTPSQENLLIAPDSKNPYAKSLDENSFINYLMLQNLTIDITKYLQLLYNFNVANTQGKQEANPSLYINLLIKLLQLKQQQNDYIENGYKDKFSYEVTKQNPYGVNNKEIFKHDNPQHEISVPELIYFLNQRQQDSKNIDVTDKNPHNNVVTNLEMVNLKEPGKQYLKIFETIKATLKGKGIKVPVIDEIISKVNASLPEIQKEECPKTQFKQLVDTIHNAVESAVNKN